MTPGVAGRAPNTGHAKLTAAAFLIVVGTVHPSPRMAAANFDTPAVIFGMPDRLFDLLLRMPGIASSLDTSRKIDGNPWLSTDDRITRYVSGC
jgi:hypothetical protein